MKNICKLLCLAGALTMASALFSGCGGGSSSSNGSSRSTKANLVFSNAISPAAATTANADSRNLTVSGNSFGSTEGIHTGFDSSEFHIFVIDESGNNFRDFELYVPFEGELTSPEVGEQINFATDEVFFDYYDDDNGIWTAVSGTATITSTSGTSVTIDLEDVVFQANGSGASGSFTLDGKVTYNENDTVNETGVGLQTSKTHKGATAAAKKSHALGTSSTKKQQNVW